MTAVNNSFTHSTVVEKACTGTSGVTVHNPVLYKPNVTNAVLATSLDADVEDAVPQAFIGVEITGENAAAGNKNMLNVWRASNYSGNRNNTLTAPRREINRMKKVWSCPSTQKIHSDFVLTIFSNNLIKHQPSDLLLVLTL